MVVNSAITILSSAVRFRQQGKALATAPSHSSSLNLYISLFLGSRTSSGQLQGSRWTETRSTRSTRERSASASDPSILRAETNSPTMRSNARVAMAERGRVQGRRRPARFNRLLSASSASLSQVIRGASSCMLFNPRNEIAPSPNHSGLIKLPMANSWLPLDAVWSIGSLLIYLDLSCPFGAIEPPARS